MMSERTKTLLLIIGVILACLLLIQGFGYGFDGFEILSTNDSLNKTFSGNIENPFVSKISRILGFWLN